jgi:hypothetical protein
VRATGIEEHLPAMERAFDADFRKEEDRYRARDGIAALLKPWFEARSLDEVRKALDEHGVCWGPYQTFTQLLDDDWRASPVNPVFGEIEHPGIGALLTPRRRCASPSIRFGRTGRRALLGMHTDEVLDDVPGSRHQGSAASTTTAWSRAPILVGEHRRVAARPREVRELAAHPVAPAAPGLRAPGRTAPAASTPTRCSTTAAPAALALGAFLPLGADAPGPTDTRPAPEMDAFPQRMWVGGRACASARPHRGGRAHAPCASKAD